MLDVLPDCVSSKYLYYDPDFSFLSLGTVSALYEINFVRNLQAYWSDRLKYYEVARFLESMVFAPLYSHHWSPNIPLKILKLYLIDSPLSY